MGPVKRGRGAMGDGISRRQFVKTIGVANVAVGVGALGGGRIPASTRKAR